MPRNILPLIFAAFAVITALSPSPSFAQVTTPSEVYNLIFSNGDGYTNMIMQQIFGPLFTGSSGVASESIFSVFVGYFNMFCFVVAGIMFFTTLATAVIQSAHEGEVLGKRWSSVWVPLRMLFVVGILMPLPSSGHYNSGQVFVAFIVKGGTSVASKVWEVGAEMVATGVAPVSAPPSNVSEEFARDIFQMEACRKIMDEHYRDAAATPEDANRIFRTIEGNYTNGVDRGIISYDRVDRNLNIIRKGVCGTAMTPAIPEYITRRMNPDASFIGSYTSAEFSNPATLAYEFGTTHFDVMMTLANNLERLVSRINIQALIDGNVFPGPSTDPVAASIVRQDSGQMPRYDISQEMARIMNVANTRLSQGHNRLIDVAVRTPDANDSIRRMIVDRIGGTCVASGNENAPSQCYGEGWMGAGGWYMIIAHLNNEIYSLFAAEPGTQGVNQNPYTSEGWMSRRDGGWNNNSSVSSDNAAKFDRHMHEYSRVFNESTIGLASLGFNFTSGQRGDISRYAMGNTQGGFFGMVDPGTISPIHFASQKVKNEVIDAVEMMHGFIFSEDPIIAIWRMGNHFVNLSIMMATLDIVIPGSILSTIAAVLFTTGSTMAFILPMLPFMFWIMAVSGYILLVIEAIASVNLWALSMMRMDGEGVTGEASRKGWMVLLGLALTPVLMIGGFIVGMIIFRVVAALVGSGMGMALSGVVSLGILPMIAGIMILSVLMMFFYIFIIDRSFSMISEFPSRIMSMVGENVHLNEGAQLKAGAIGAAAATGRASSGVFQNVNSTIGGRFRANREAHRNRLEGSLGKGGGGGGKSPSSPG